MSNKDRKRITDERLMEMIEWAVEDEGGDYVVSKNTALIGELAGEVLEARRWVFHKEDPSRIPEFAGHDGTWRSGPLMATVSLGVAGGVATINGVAVGDFTLCLYWRGQLGDPEDPRKVYWVDFELFEIVAIRNDSVPTYQVRDAETGWDLTDDLDRAELAASGFVKWDGCTQFQVADVHADHRRDLERLRLPCLGRTSRASIARIKVDTVTNMWDGVGMKDITRQEQLDRWVAGESVHRDSECCPDFSCCKPELGVQLEVRRAFIAGDEASQTALLGSFLEAAVALASEDTVHVAGASKETV